MPSGFDLPCVSNDDVVEGLVDAAKARKANLDYHGVVDVVRRRVSSYVADTAILGVALVSQCEAQNFGAICSAYISPASQTTG